MAYDIEETLDIEGHDVVKVSYPISSYVADKGFNDYIVIKIILIVYLQ